MLEPKLGGESGAKSAKVLHRAASARAFMGRDQDSATEAIAAMNSVWGQALAKAGKRAHRLK